MRLPVHILLLCHLSSQLFDLCALSSTEDVHVLLLNKPNDYYLDCKITSKEDHSDTLLKTTEIRLTFMKISCA